MSTPPKYAHVDALRGIAILLVIALHTGQCVTPGLFLQQFTSFGGFGVQLFFVMSAFTLCHSLKKVPALDAREYGSFLLRRFFRIAPLYYLAIGAYYAFTLAADKAGFESTYTSLSTYTPLNVLSNFLFVHGLYPPGNNGIVPGGWSIGCEFLFYAAFPFLFFGAQRRPRLLVWAGVAAMLATAGMVVAKGFFGRDQSFSGSLFLHWFVTTQSPCFFLGMAYYFHGHRAGFRRAFKLAALPALVLLFFMQGTAWGWILKPALAGVASVALALTLEGSPRLPAWLLRIGETSFSLYLAHFIPVMLFGHLFRVLLPASLQNSLAAGLCFVLVVGVSYVISLLSHRLIETPGIALGRRLADSLAARPPALSQRGDR